MADLLDQGDIDALLAAAATGGASSGGDADPSPQAQRRVQTIRTDVGMYDFKRPDRVSKDQMRALEGLHDGFARNLGASLSGFLRTIVETRVAICEQLTYSEFIRSLPSPTCFNLLNVPPLTGQMCLEISPLIIYPIIDRLLGGNSTETIIPQRPLTNIEQRLVGRITERALAGLTEAWSQVVEVEFKVAETESNPQLVQIVAPNEVVVVIGFEIKLGARSGTMSLCIPFNVVEPAIQKLATQSWLAYSQGSGRQGNVDQIQRRLNHARIGLRAYLGETSITVRDLFSLSVGDVLPLEKSIHQEVLVQVEGRNKFAGQMAQRRGKRVIRITRRIDAEDIL
jgi:flagellar motor switch protein FliM